MAKEKFYLYIDDSGWRYPNQVMTIREDGLDYFALGGILIKGSDYDGIVSKHSMFCLKWKIDYPLHSYAIRGRRKKFLWLQDDLINEQFNKELMELMCDIPAIGFAVVIDRAGYNARYKEKYDGEPWSMCKTAFAILIERVSKYVGEQGFRFKIIFENCGPKEEDAIIEYFKDLRRVGPPFNSETSAKYGGAGKELFQLIPYGDPTVHTKKSPFLQFADLYLYPMVKGGYDKSYFPYKRLMERSKLIDAIIDKSKIETHGIKYSCFTAR